jgi:general secretion pathway protein C
MKAAVAQTLRLDGELATRLMAQAPRWAMGLLVVLLGVRAATLVAALVSPPVLDAAAPITALAAGRAGVDIPAVLRANLFGMSQAVAGIGSAPVTSMALVLAGVFADADEKRGFAMLGTSTADIKFYRVGDTLPGGARLHAVQLDRVLVDRGGAIEALLLPPRTGALLGAPPPVVQAAPAVSTGRVQQIMRENPAIIGQVIQRQAVFADGKLRGMRVYPGSNPQAFSKLGLRPGDLVTAINGTALDDQTRGNEIFNTLGNSADARITVIRGGSQQDLVLNLAEIANEAERLAQAPVGVDQAGLPVSTR